MFFIDRFQFQALKDDWHLKTWSFIFLSLLASFFVTKYFQDRHDDNIYYDKAKSTATNCSIPHDFIPIPSMFKNPPSGEHNIFFVETWRMCNKMAHLTPRAACAIESAAHVNPLWDIYIFFMDVIGYDEASAALINKLLKYPNIHIIGISIEELGEDTSLHQWILEKHYEKSKFLVSHISDLVRILVLYKYAGTYMDTDIISLKPTGRLGTNYAAAESAKVVASGFMNFGNDELGRSVITELITRFESAWNPTDWIAQGPGLITLVMNQLCRTKNTAEMTYERCGGVRALPTKEILAIDFGKRNYFFEDTFLEEGLKIIENSTVTHLWNAFSGKVKVLKSSYNLLNHLARRNCPSVFSEDSTVW